MPTTLTGLILLVLLVLPGITFVSLREKGIPERRRSVFRETATVVVAGVAANIVSFWVLVPIGAALPQDAPNVSDLTRDAASYIEAHYLRVAVWATGLVLLAVLLAAGAAWLAGKTSPHPSTMSSWWVLFEHWKKGRDISVGCVLDDGSWIGGQLGSFSIDAEETNDRDLILKTPIQLAHSPQAPSQPYDVAAVCIPARRINALYVSYLAPGSLNAATPTAQAEGEVAAEGEAPVESASAEHSSASAPE